MFADPVTEYHVPALAEEVASLADGRRRIVDCTVGGGGHASRLLAVAERMLAIDRDPDAIAVARERIPDERVVWHLGSFAAPHILEAIADFQPDFVLFDLGISFRQVDDDTRGFSFRRGVSLDMRMNPSVGPAAADLLNTLEPNALAKIFAEVGDEPRARGLAAAVARRRTNAKFQTSDDFVGAIRSALGARSGPSDFARLFQALRIAVNRELEDLQTALPVVRDAVQPGGIIAVISYHSGEDRRVKRLFQEWSRSCTCPPRQPVCTCRGRPFGRMDPKRPIRPSEAETARNPRSRSAKLRVFRRADTP